MEFARNFAKNRLRRRRSPAIRVGGSNGGARFFKGVTVFPETDDEDCGSGGGRWRRNLKLVEGFCFGQRGDHDGGVISSKRQAVCRKMKREGGSARFGQRYGECRFRERDG